MFLFLVFAAIQVRTRREGGKGFGVRAESLEVSTPVSPLALPLFLSPSNQSPVGVWCLWSSLSLSLLLLNFACVIQSLFFAQSNVFTFYQPLFSPNIYLPFLRLLRTNDTSYDFKCLCKCPALNSAAVFTHEGHVCRLWFLEASALALAINLIGLTVIFKFCNWMFLDEGQKIVSLQNGKEKNKNEVRQCLPCPGFSCNLLL